MLSFKNNLLRDESGFGTIEVIILLAILVGLALLFKEQITIFVSNILDSIIDTDLTVE